MSDSNYLSKPAAGTRHPPKSSSHSSPSPSPSSDKNITPSAIPKKCLSSLCCWMWSRFAESNGDNSGDSDFSFSAFFRMYGREEELKDLQSVVVCISFTGLFTADNPEAACFCFGKSVYSASYIFYQAFFRVEDNFYGCERFAGTAMDYLCSKSFMESKVGIV